MIVTFVMLACIVGAALGREISALLGWERLMKLARPRCGRSICGAAFALRSAFAPSSTACASI